MLRKASSAVTTANRCVSITTVCRLAGVDIDDFDGVRSVKTYCPFGSLYHSDAGREPALRVYPQTNTAYCFACARHYTPVTLAATLWSCRYTQAADELLQRAGVRRARADSWRDACAVPAPAPDASHLAQALSTFCARICPDWEEVQFDPTVLTALDRCLSLLPLVGDDVGARLWLDTCKVVMTRCLRTSSLAVD